MKFAEARFILLFFGLFLCNESTPQNNKFGIDSVLYSYLNKCEKTQNIPITLEYADTLYKLANAKNDDKMRIVAICQKLNYYRNTKNTDSIISIKEQVQKLAKATNQPVYYFHAWSILISHYISSQKQNMAITEAREYQKQAIAQDYEAGIANSYKTIGNIYYSLSHYSAALENFQNHIDFVNEKKIDDYNIFNSYIMAGKCLRLLGKLDEASFYYGEAKRKTKRDFQNIRLLQEDARLQITKNDTVRLKEIIDSSRILFSKFGISNSYKANSYDIESRYYILTKQYDKALSLCDSVDKYKGNSVFSRLAIYPNINMLNEAIKLYQTLLGQKDSIIMQVSRTSLIEYTTLLEVDQLNQQKKDLEIAVKNKKILIGKIVAIFVGLVVLSGAVLFSRIYKLNSSLKKSKNEIEKNHNDLIVAFERVEMANRMKNILLQNLSHEVRTPINALMGFSHIITNKVKDNKNLKKYSDIIEVSSIRLLKLITDIVEISEYDSGYSNDPAFYTPELHSISVNKVCAEQFEEVRPLVSNNVLYEFNPLPDDIEIKAFKKGFERMVLNLLHNATEFTKMGRITLSCELNSTKSELIITVSDTGEVIPESKRNKIFDRYYKVDEFSHGFGIDLPLCKIFADRMHANLKLDSTYSLGSKFIFTLPLSVEVHS